ncbi:MAG: hypothetical protein M1826_002034 [Phylliscum demangeonii]|nr:MAG: hypothetical protein M1826_002034 [Phylliscum demangeonii]
MLSGTSRSTSWDAIAGNTGQMMLAIMSLGPVLDLGPNPNVDVSEFESGFVLERKPGCYKARGSWSSTGTRSTLPLDHVQARESSSTGRELHDALDRIEIGHGVEHDNWILMRSEKAYMSVERGRPMMLRTIISELISNRKRAKWDRQADRSWAYRLRLVGVYGAMGSRHAVIGSKTGSEITTYNEISCMTTGMKVKKAIERLSGTLFASVSADVKGNYSSIVISAKKKD